jgi:hypothetical protein
MAQQPTTVQPKPMEHPKKGEPWRPTVDVILDVQNDTFHFETDDLPLGPHTKLTFQNDGYPGFTITFHLKDPPDGYRFPEDLDEALWVTDQPICPDEPCKWSQFKAKAVLNNGQDLVVRNLNEKKQEFGYVLRVTKNGTEFMNLDPVGGNENGSTSLNIALSGYAFAAVGGAVVGSLITLGVQAMLAG